MFKKIRKIIKNERGASLVEAVIALGLLGLIATTFLMAIFIATKSIAIADERTTAESLARTQMESVKQQEYDYGGIYLEITTPDSYESTFTVEDIETGLQKITVTIRHPGEVEPILTLEGYKVDEGVY
jgi:type II secretory pathway pseudopilin PulG